MSYLYKHNFLPMILSGQNGFFDMVIGGYFYIQNSNLSHLNSNRIILSGHPDNRTTGQPDNRTIKIINFKKTTTIKKMSTRTQFSKEECASKYAMLLFYVFNNIYNLSSKKYKKIDTTQTTEKMRDIMSGCPVVRLSGCPDKIRGNHENCV